MLDGTEYISRRDSMAWYTVAMMRLWAISLTVVLALPAQALADDVTVLVVTVPVTTRW